MRFIQGKYFTLLLSDINFAHNVEVWWWEKWSRNLRPNFMDIPLLLHPPFQGPDWQFQTQLPDWAEENWSASNEWRKKKGRMQHTNTEASPQIRNSWSSILKRIHSDNTILYYIQSLLSNSELRKKDERFDSWDMNVGCLCHFAMVSFPL